MTLSRSGIWEGQGENAAESMRVNALGGKTVCVNGEEGVQGVRGVREAALDRKTQASGRGLGVQLEP